MVSYKGNAVSEGIALGNILFLQAEMKHDFGDTKVSDIDKEVQRLVDGCSKAADQLMELYEKASADSADDGASEIFMVHSMMLQDDDFIQAMKDLIKDTKCCAEHAVTVISKQFADDLAASGSDYIAERGSDVADVSTRVIQILQGKETSIELEGDDPIVLMAEELTPSQTLMFDRSKLLALVSRKGSKTSHTAILARSLNIPAVICPDLNLECNLNGKVCIVNGLTGDLIIEPDNETEKEASKCRDAYVKEQKELESLKDKDAVTKSGQKVKIFGNAGNLEDIDYILDESGEGVGLFRSEFLYLGRETLPTEEELTQVYSNAAKKLNGKLLVVRTLDIGADKKAPCLPLEEEPNPALGIRALRLCFESPDVFITQLRSILRASAVGNIGIMFPMIISVAEIKKAKEMIQVAAKQLEEEKIPYKLPDQVGIMIETPAAAIISDLLAKEVDFFSIGSNDLTQYTLAIDRQNERLEKYCDTHHEAVLRLIEISAKNAHDNGIWCGICGELGSDLELTQRFVNAGIDELSVYPAAILKLKKKIREL